MWELLLPRQSCGEHSMNPQPPTFLYGQHLPHKSYTLLEWREKFSSSICGGFIFVQQSYTMLSTWCEFQSFLSKFGKYCCINFCAKVSIWKWLDTFLDRLNIVNVISQKFKNIGCRLIFVTFCMFLYVFVQS